MVEITVKTESNLFIGGVPRTFEIGGVDQYTATDRENRPCIPASSFKGAVRNIVRDIANNKLEADNDIIKALCQSGVEIGKLYAEYLKQEKIKNEELIEKLLSDTKKREYKEDIDDKIKNASPLYLFGIEAFNNAPKLIFNDLSLDQEACGNEKDWFSNDAKNSIIEEEGQLKSNPRIYRVAQPGLVFHGSIRFYRFSALGDNAKELCSAFICSCLKVFNDGIYRLGNSKSRGYGRIEVTRDGED